MAKDINDKLDEALQKLNDAEKSYLEIYENLDILDQVNESANEKGSK